MLAFCYVIMFSFWLLRREKTGKGTCERWECVCKYDEWRGVTRTGPTTKKDVLERKMSLSQPLLAIISLSIASHH